MVSKYSRVDFDEEVRMFRLATRRKTRKPVELLGWRLCIAPEQTYLEVSVLNHEGVVLTRNVAI